MTQEQIENVGLIIVLGAILAIFIAVFAVKELRSWRGFFRALARLYLWAAICVLTGIGGSVFLTNKSVLNVIMLYDTSGYGRGYVAGLAMAVAGFLVLLIKVVRMCVPSTFRRDHFRE